MRLTLAPRSMEGIKEKLLKSRDQKSGKKYLQKLQKRKIKITKKKKNIIPLFRRLERSLTSLLSSL
jgi:hypothetical protein